jgi:putative hydrolase of the HAD superfamily
MTASALAARLRGTEAWVFDLDNTLYPATSSLYDAIGERMTAYIARAAQVDEVEALRLREHYFDEYGATVVGLAKHHGVEASDFLAHVHDLDHADALTPDAELKALIGRLPGRRIVFTNGGGGHGQRVLEALELSPLFEHLFDIEAAALTPKPQHGAYEKLVAATGIAPQRSVFIEDTLRNLEPAYGLGFFTVLIGPASPSPAADPKATYVDHWAHDLKVFLREALDG